jgi:hypothetical protein
VVFVNTGERRVDAIKWRATVYNNFKEVKATRSDEWNAGVVFGPFGPGETNRVNIVMNVENGVSVKISGIMAHCVD